MSKLMIAVLVSALFAFQGCAPRTYSISVSDLRNGVVDAIHGDFTSLSGATLILVNNGEVEVKLLINDGNRVTKTNLAPNWFFVYSYPGFLSDRTVKNVLITAIPIDSGGRFKAATTNWCVSGSRRINNQTLVLESNWSEGIMYFQ